MTYGESIWFLAHRGDAVEKRQAGCSRGRGWLHAALVAAAGAVVRKRSADSIISEVPSVARGLRG